MKKYVAKMISLFCSHGLRCIYLERN